MKNSPLFWLASAIVLMLVVSNTFFVVDQRERALIFQLGEIQGTDYAPGLHMKIPFVQSALKLDARVLGLDTNTENFLTKEKKNVEVDYFVKWRIADATAYYRATRGEKLVAADRLSAIVNSGLRDEFGSRTIQEALAGERDQIMQALGKTATEKVRELGIELIDVRLKSINLPAAVSDSVYERMRAERTRTASEFRAKGAEEAEKIRANADREAQVKVANAYRDSEILRGEGDAKAADIYARAYGQDSEFYGFYRTLNVYKDVFQDKSNVLVLEPKGEFFRYFKGDGAAR